MKKFFMIILTFTWLAIELLVIIPNILKDCIYAAIKELGNDL